MPVAEKPGLVVSSAAHAAMLAAAFVSFSATPKFQDAQEAIPVEMVSAQDLNEIMRGEKTAKAVQPKPRADKVAEVIDTKPQPPVAEAKKDVPTPPMPPERQPDPTKDVKPEPPKPPPVAVQTPPPPPPPEAEATEPRPEPVPRPKIEPAKEEPKKPDPKLKPDEIAKLLKDQKPVDKPAKPKTTEDATPNKFNVADISKLISHAPPERKASTNTAVSPTPTLGSQNANASKMSPSLQAQMDGWFQDHLQGCWTTPISEPSGSKYVPMVRIALNLDGSLSTEPVLVNPPADPAWRPLAESAVRAVRKCNPLPIPDRFKPYYEDWRDRIVRFNFEAT